MSLSKMLEHKIQSGLNLIEREHGAHKAFVRVAWATLRKDSTEELFEELGRDYEPRVREYAKAAAGATSWDEAWAGVDGEALAEAFLRTVEHRSLLDTLRVYARPVPAHFTVGLVAVGTVGGSAQEGYARLVRKINLNSEDLTKHRAAGIVAMSREFLDSTGGAGARLFEIELSNAVVAASNAEVMSALSTASVPSTGTAVGDLKSGLAAAADSEGYVVAAAPGVVRELAIASEGRMGVRGGEFIPGVRVTPVTGADMTIIPASRILLADMNLSLRRSRHATVEMDDEPAQNIVTPTAPTGEVVNLFQCDTEALLVERRFRFHQNADAIVVGEAD